MSCSSIKHRFEHLKSQGALNFTEAKSLYDDLMCSLHSHRLELQELEKTNDRERIDHLQHHISDGEQMLADLNRMSLH
jgi:polyhydroxyalkanoate synthesis regulator phasin